MRANRRASLKVGTDGADGRSVGRRSHLIGLLIVITSFAAVSTVSTVRADSASGPYARAERITGSGSTNPAGPTPDRSGAGAGHLDLLLHAKAQFDPHTEPTDAATWTEMRATYDAMVVYAPYFDERVSLFGREFGYENLYGLKPADDRTIAHPEWILRTGNGNPVYIPFGCGASGGCPQYAADIGNPGYQEEFLSVVGDLVDAGYHGLMVDDVNMLQRFSDRNGNWLWPINPRTGAEMTLAEWRASVAALLERVRTQYPDLRIMHNAIWYSDSPTFDDRDIDRQIGAADFIMLERGATDRGLTGGDGKYSYARFIEFIERVHERGANVLLLDETATNDREQMFNLATALLINDGHDLVSTEDPDRIAPGSVWPGFEIDLGDALGTYERDGAIWRRDFDDGIVVSHEPGGSTRTVALGGTFRTASGETVTQVVLRPREAAVLYRL